MYVYIYIYIYMYTHVYIHAHISRPLSPEIYTRVLELLKQEKIALRETSEPAASQEVLSARL